MGFETLLGCLHTHMHIHATLKALFP